MSGLCGRERLFVGEKRLKEAQAGPEGDSGTASQQLIGWMYWDLWDLWLPWEQD